MSRKAFLCMVPQLPVWGKMSLTSYAEGKTEREPPPAIQGDSAPTPAWFNVKQYGAVGDGQADDATAIQQAIDVAQQYGAGSVIYLPPGRYALSRTLAVTRHGLLVHAEGTLTPHNGFTGFLLRLNGHNTTSMRGNDNWQGKIDIERLAIDGRYQSRGLLVEQVDHAMISNVLVERTVGTGVHVAGVRESDLLNMTLAGCDARNDANVLVFQDRGDGANNVRFYGLNVVYCAGQALRIDSGGSAVSRNLSFFGAQIHYLDRPKPWGAPTDGTVVIEILRARQIRFIGCNLRGGASAAVTVLALGAERRVAQGTSFLGCFISADASGATGVHSRNAADVSYAACGWQVPRGRRTRGNPRQSRHNGPDTIGLAPTFASPERPAPGTLAVADGVAWDPDGRAKGRPYPVFFDGVGWTPVA